MPKKERAYFAAGCFWGVEDQFQKTLGVVDAVSGYSGGKKENPTYEDVKTGKSGHTETVEVTFDPEVTSFQELLDVFWKLHDPTQINQQGPNWGSNYRSAIFFQNEGQKKAALDSKRKLEESGKFEYAIATEIVPLKKFFRAEEYHQNYFEKNKGSCFR